MATKFDPHEAPHVELDRVASETSIEAFDRIAYARELVTQLLPETRAAICAGTREVQVFSGRLWGARSGVRWIMVTVPPTASRRAIVEALTTHAGVAPPFLLDVFLGPYRAP